MPDFSFLNFWVWKTLFFKHALHHKGMKKEFFQTAMFYA
jgi:hypothetical protein